MMQTLKLIYFPKSCVYEEQVYVVTQPFGCSERTPAYTGKLRLTHFRSFTHPQNPSLL